MKISVAIPTNGLRPESLQRLLGALAQQTDQPYEVLVIDASEDLRNIQNPGPWKFSHIPAEEPNLPLQRWQAVSHTRGEIIAFFDDDVVPQPTYLERIARRYELDVDHTVGGVGGWLLHQPAPTNADRRSIRLALAGVKWNGILHRGGLLKWWDEPPDCEEIEVPCLSGPAMSYRTSVLRAIGPQPWLYDLYHRKIGRAEDVMLSSLVRRVGYKLILLPANVAIHHAGEAGSAYASKGYDKGVAHTWSRYLSSRLVSEDWDLMDEVAFFRYAVVLVASNVIRSQDWAYLRGATSGLSKCLYAKLPFEE